MKINEDFIKVNVGGECSLVPTDSKYENGVFTLNETAERIYDLLHEGKSRDEVVTVLCDEYDTDCKTAGVFTDEFIAKLQKSGILTNG